LAKVARSHGTATIVANASAIRNTLPGIQFAVMAMSPSRPEKDTQENEPERSSRIYVLIILGIIVASLAIFIVLSHPTRTTSAPAHSFLIPMGQHLSVDPKHIWNPS